MTARVLVVDNADSFVHTLCDYLRQLDAVVSVVPSRDVAHDHLAPLLARSDALVLSPGPGAPQAATGSLAALRAAGEHRVPVLGVCLGHQVIAHAFGAHVGEAPELRHGMTSTIVHDGSGLYAGLDQGFAATRYHSLAAVPETVPAQLAVTATTPEGTVMGLAHRELPIDGVQFHPESILSEGGFAILSNWLRLRVAQTA